MYGRGGWRAAVHGDERPLTGKRTGDDRGAPPLPRLRRHSTDVGDAGALAGDRELDARRGSFPAVAHAGVSLWPAPYLDVLGSCGRDAGSVLSCFHIVGADRPCARVDLWRQAL